MPGDVGDETDERSFRLGSISSWSEAVAVGVKELALSAPVSPAEMATLQPEAERIAANHGVSVYLEKDFLVTDLFPAAVTDGKQVLFLYRPPTLDRYLLLKKTKAELLETGKYEGVAREAIAREFGRLLSYPDAVIDEKLANNGAEILGSASSRPTFAGVWKSPTISLDDERWLIQDVACRNGCSAVSYQYLGDLLDDPANDDISVFDLHADTLAFNRRFVSSLTRPKALEAWANYHAAADAALDCTPEGDGLQHQITAPPAIEFEYVADRILIKYEYWNAVRTVYMDGREIPTNPVPSRLGYSVGRYDGDELVIRTVGLVPSQISLMGNKFYLSEEAEFVEHYRSSGNGTRMDIEWTVIDDVNLRGPYTGRMSWLAAPGWELDRWHCEAITGEF